MNTVLRPGSKAWISRGWPRNGHSAAPVVSAGRLVEIAAAALGQPERRRRAGLARHGLDVEADHDRQLGDHAPGLLGIVDQLDLDIEQLEQRLRVVGAGLGQMALDLRPQPLEQLLVGALRRSRPTSSKSAPAQRGSTPASAIAATAASSLRVRARR